MDAHEPQEVVLQHQQVQHDALCVPRDGDHARARHGVEHEVVGGGDDGGQDEPWVRHAADDQRQPLPAAELDGHRGHREADEERVAEVQGWHGRYSYGVSASQCTTEVDLRMERSLFEPQVHKRVQLTILVAELVRGPDAALAIRPVDRVDESVRLGLLCVRALVVRVAQQPGWHAGPAREDDKGEEVAHGHRPSPLLIQRRVERGKAHGLPSSPGGRGLARQGALRVTPGPCRREVVEDH